MSPGCYRGRRTSAGCKVTRPDGSPLPLAPSLALRRHSPTGWEWGYSGSGPAQLALALLLDVGAPAAVALQHCQRFKVGYVQRWRGARWTLDADEAVVWLAAAGAAVMICPTGEPHAWAPEWRAADTWHGGTEYRTTCRRCGMHRARIQDAPADADTWNANGTTYLDGEPWGAAP